MKQQPPWFEPGMLCVVTEATQMFPKNVNNESSVYVKAGTLALVVGKDVVYWGLVRVMTGLGCFWVSIRFLALV